jgi:hypothetical protein
MDFEANEVINVSIDIEKSLGKLYRRFGDLFPEDTTLWRSLSHEEKIHTILLKDTSVEDINSSFINRLHDLKEVRSIIDNKLDIYKSIQKCDKLNAFEDAIEIEAVKAKVHSEIGNNKKIDKKIQKTFLLLKGKDKDNITRLKKRAYTSKDISVSSY